MATFRARDLNVKSGISVTDGEFVFQSDWTDPRNPAAGSIEILAGDFGGADVSIVCTTVTGTGQYQVNWGDGVTEQFNSGATASHTYTVGNGRPCSIGYTTYVAKVTGYSGQSLGSFSVPTKPTDGSSAYSIIAMGVNCSTLSSFQIQSVNSLVAFKGVFSSTLTTLSSAFADCYGLKSVELSGVSGVTTTSSMFSDCYTLSHFSTTELTSATDTSFMFYNCRVLREIDLSPFVAVTNPSWMFDYCYSLQSVSNLPTVGSTATNCNGMFEYCRSLLEIDISSFTNMTTCQDMFHGCDLLRKVTTASSYPYLTNTFDMFWSCECLDSVNISGMTEVSDARYMFAGCKNISSITATNFGANATYTHTDIMFEDCHNLETISFPNIKATLLPFDSSTSVTSRTTSINFNISNLSVRNGTLVHNVEWTRLSVSSLQTILDALPSNTYFPWIYMQNNYNVTSSVVSKSVTGTLNNATVTCADTSGLSAGMKIFYSSNSAGYLRTSATITTGANTISLGSSFSIPNDTKIAFSYVNASCGIVLGRTYYVINHSTGTFQISETQGGSAVTITATTYGTFHYTMVISSIVTNTSITFQMPFGGSVSCTLKFCDLDPTNARAKGWKLYV